MFIYSLPILFTYIQFGTAQEYRVTILFLLILLFIVTPSNPFFKDIKWGRVSELTMYRYLFDSWTAQVKLWLVFWPYFIILNLSLYTVDTLAKAGEFSISSWDEVHLISLTPSIFWIISVWRNSLNTCSHFWAIGARFVTFFVLFEYGLRLAIRINYPRVFFQCNEVTLDYLACF